MPSRSILLVDDEANVLKALKRLFIDSDYRILTADSGEKGLEVLETETVALVVSDYRMPGMTGVQFLAKVKDLFPSTIRIILSGYADVAAIVEAINDGEIYKFLAKPWNDQELLTTIQRALEHFDLQNENSGLLAELKIANTGLQLLTTSLEEQVAERTRDLQYKNRALLMAQRLLDLLPAGVIGIDQERSLVYMNSSLRNFVDVSGLGLGDTLGSEAEAGPLKTLVESLDRQEVTCSVDESRGGLRIICAPLPQGVGVVGLLCYADLERHASEPDSLNHKSEAPHAT